MAKKTPTSITWQSEAPKASSVASTSHKKLFTNDIVEAFTKDLEKKHTKYSSLSKQELVSKFRDFIRTEYDNKTLDALLAWKIKGESIDVELSAISHKSFRLEDLMDPQKRALLNTNFHPSRSEQDVIESAVYALYTKTKKSLAPATRSKLDIDAFLSRHWYRKSPDTDNPDRIYAWSSATRHDAASFARARREQVYDNISDPTQREEYIQDLDVSQFDPSEKISCMTLVDKLKSSIVSVFDWTTKKDVLDIFEVRFAYDPSFVHAQTSRVTFEWLAVAVEWFLKDIAPLVDEATLQKLKNIHVSFADVFKLANRYKLLQSDADKRLLRGRYSELKSWTRHLANGFVQYDLLDKAWELVEQVEQETAHYSEMFDIPWDFKQFFWQFWRPEALQWKFVDGQYILLKKQIESLKDHLWSSWLSASEKKKTQEDLHQAMKKLQDHQAVTQAKTWEEYFEYIAKQVKTASKETAIDVDASSLSAVLTKLKDVQWDVAKLTPSEQNILMRSSIALQLLKVRDRHGFKTLWYSFESYAKFVESLYDLDSTQARIPTKDGQYIDLQFWKKHLVWKPLEFENVDISDIDVLENIRVEFEIDLNNNPQAKQFFRNLSGGTRSALIQDFYSWTNGFPHKSWFPETITDSSLVSIVDRYGNTYEWYLSATDVMLWSSSDEEYEDMSVKSFVLYTKPADQLHQDRGFVAKKKLNWELDTDSSWNEQAVMIHAWNADTWKSVQVLDEKLTLSGKQLGALTLWHMIAQELSLEELTSEDTSSQIHNTLQKADEAIVKWLEQDTKDYADVQELSQTQQSVSEQSSTAQAFKQSWERLIDADESHAPTLGTRIAVKYPSTIDGVQTLKTFPDAEQLLALTIVWVERDAEWNIEAAEFSFDSLSRIGRVSISNITLKWSELDKIWEVFLGWVTYLDNPTQNKTSYPEILNRLQKNFSDPVRKKTYIRGDLQSLDFDGSHFTKQWEKISCFISAKKTHDASWKHGDHRFDVEYQVEKVWSNSYRVTSTPYAASVADKSWALKKKNIGFETTTDLTWVALILANKQLVPYTKKEYDTYKEEQKGDNSTIPAMEKSRFPLSTIRSVLTWKWKELVEAFKKKLKDKHEEEFNYMLFTQWGLMNKLGNSRIWQGLWAFGLNVFEDAALDIMKEWQEFGWKKINWFLELLNTFHKSYNAYGPSGMQLARDLLSWAQKKIQSGWKLTMKDRRKAAAVLLYSMDQMWSVYARWLAKPGDYVKILFGAKYYQHFKRIHDELVIEAQAQTEAWKDAEHRLAMLEYNFIVSNTRWWSDLEKIDAYVVDGESKVFYFQDLYSRKFGSEVASRMNKIQNFSSGDESEEVKNLMATNDFEFVYRECVDHLADLRTVDFVNELIALTKMAKDPTQADRVSGLFMAGLLGKIFNNNLSRNDRGALKNAMYTMGVPYAHFIDTFYWSNMMKQLLMIATGSWAANFEKFSYTVGKKSLSYSPDDFDYLSDGAKLKGFIGGFVEWFNQYKGQIIPFLHMDPQSMKSDNNMIRIRKSQERPMNIFWRELKESDIDLVSEVLNTFYYVPYGRRVTLTNTNPDSEFTHTASMIDGFFPMINKYENGIWNEENRLHADLAWPNIKNNAPRNKESPHNKYLLAWHVNEFFRYFNGIGSIVYNRQSIEDFYRYVRLAQNQNTTQDKIRVFRFAMTNSLYNSWPVPDDAKHAFGVYMRYFEENIDNFDKELGETHRVPWWSQDNFGEILSTDPKDMGIRYIPQLAWDALGRKWQNDQAREYARDTMLLNRWMETENYQKKTWWGRFGGWWNTRKIGKSIDSMIRELRWVQVASESVAQESKILPIDVQDEKKPKLIIDDEQEKEKIHQLYADLHNKPKRSDSWQQSKLSRNDIDAIRDEILDDLERTA